MIYSLGDDSVDISGEDYFVAENATVVGKVRLENNASVWFHAVSRGENAVILNEAQVGNNCLIGANTLIAEGKEIPDGSLVMGSPAKIIRTLSEEQQARLVMSAEIYVKNFKRFKAEMQADQRN